MNSQTKCQSVVPVKHDTQGHVYLESIQFRAVYKLKSLPTKQLLILNKEKLLGGSTTRVNQYIHMCYTDSNVCFCVLFFSPKKIST